jgi:hypothetical protein
MIRMRYSDYIKSIEWIRVRNRVCLSCHEDVHTFPKIKEDVANFASRRDLEPW